MIFPLRKMKKFNAIKLVLKLKILLELTWSCYWGFEEPGGKHSSCLERERILKILKYNDLK